MNVSLNDFHRFRQFVTVDCNTFATSIHACSDAPDCINIELLNFNSYSKF